MKAFHRVPSPAEGLGHRYQLSPEDEARVLSGTLRTYPLTRRLGLPVRLAASGRSLLRYDGGVLVLTGPEGDLREAGAVAAAEVDAATR